MGEKFRPGSPGTAADPRSAVTDLVKEPAFDDLVWLATELVGTPIALVSLIDATSQRIAARIGLEMDEVPLDQSFCRHALDHDGVFVIADASIDPRFAGNPLVTGPPGLRFYAGAPLVAGDGEALGTICVFDTVPRTLGERQRLALLALARRAVAQLERRKLLLQQRAQAMLYRSVLDSAADAFIGVDPGGTIVEFNAAAETIFGWSRDEAVGRDFVTLLLPEDRHSAARELLTDILAGGLTGTSLGQRTEARALRRGGDEFPVELSAAVVVVEGLVQVNAFVTDISDRRRAEQHLRESQAEIADFLQSAADMIQVADMTGTLVYVNASWCETLGYSQEAAAGLSLWDIVPSDQHRDVRERRAALLRGERVERVDGELVARDGRRVPIEGAVTLQLRDGVPVAVRGMFRDVSVRRAAEEAREGALRVLEEQNARLRQIDRMRDELVQLVSHELRTPLASVLGYVELLRGGEAGPLNAEQERFLAVIGRNGQRLGAVVDDLLVLAQIDSGELVIHAEPVDVLELARETAETFRERAAHAGVTLIVDGTATPACTTDRRRLGQVLDNLMSNAVKYTLRGGTVTVRVRSSAETVELEVEDTGIGISEDALPHVFNRFFRSPEAVGSSVPGVGLGLAITHSLVDALGGRITVESQPGQGTRFGVTLAL